MIGAPSECSVVTVVMRGARADATGAGTASSDANDLEAAIAERLAANGGREPAEWWKPARELGVTPLFASALLNKPLRDVRAAFLVGRPPHLPPIGRRDAWDCLYASVADIHAAFGQICATSQHEPAAMQRVRAKADALREKLRRPA